MTSGALTAVVVEDQVVLRDWLVSLLVQRGVDVVAAVGTVADGARAITGLDPDVAIVDNGLPDDRGIDLCREIARTMPTVRLILHTGLLSATEECQALEAGVAAVVLKSIRSGELLDLVETLKPGSPAALP